MSTIKRTDNTSVDVVLSDVAQSGHSTILSDSPETPSTVNVGQSGFYAGTWLTSRVFNVMQWAMVSNAVLLGPDEAEAIGWALINGAQASRANADKLPIG